MATLRSLPLRTWPRAVPIALVAYVFIAVPSDLIDTPWFGRPVEIRAYADRVELRQGAEKKGLAGTGRALDGDATTKFDM